MNILALSWRGPGHPMAGGAEQVTWRHLTSWSKAGHQVTLFTSHFPGSPNEEILDNIKIIREGDQFIGVKLKAFIWYLKNKQHFDLVVDEHHGIPFFTPLYVRVKKLGFVHEVASKVWALNPWPPPWRYIPAIVGPIFEPLILKFLYRNTQFLTVSPSTKTDLKKLGVKNVTVIFNGLNLPKNIKLSKKEKNFTVIYLSALAQDKGTEDAIKAFDLVKQRLPSSQFWVVGKSSSEYLSYLHTLSSNPKYFGFVSETEKFNLLSKAHVLLFPSIHEGWGLVIIEANSCGLPAVAYDVAGCKDAIKHQKTGFLCPVKDVNCLANSLINLSKNNNLYTYLSKNSLAWSKKFNWSDSTKKSLELIQSL